jgi:hypothetical protein
MEATKKMMGAKAGGKEKREGEKEEERSGGKTKAKERR